MNELRNKVTADVESHEGLETTNTGATYEDGGGAVPEIGGGTRSVFGGGREGGDLVVVQFDDGWVNSDGSEKLLHDVAHAARRSCEYDDWVLCYEPLDLGLH